MQSIDATRQFVTSKSGNRNSNKRCIFGLIVVVLSGIVSLLVAEGLVRLLAPQPLILLRPDIWVPAKQLGWRHSPNIDTRVNTGEREIQWRTDAGGFRIGANRPGASDMMFVALGDSFVEAMQVEYEDTLTSLLENRLSSRLRRSLRILNTAVGGWDPNQYRIQLERLLKVNPVDGIIVFVYLGNDVIEKRVDNYAPRQPAERHSLRLPKSLKWNEFVTAIAYPINDSLEVRSHMFILVKNRLKYVLMRAGLTAYYFPDSLLVTQASSKRWSATADVLKEIAVIGRDRDLQTLFVLIPSPAEADPVEAQRTAQALGIAPEDFDIDQAHMLLGAEMKRRDLSTLDTTSALRAAIAKQMPDVYGRIDNHLGKGGHRVVANAIEDAIWQKFCLPHASLEPNHAPVK